MCFIGAYGGRQTSVQGKEKLEPES